MSSVTSPIKDLTDEQFEVLLSKVGDLSDEQIAAMLIAADYDCQITLHFQDGSNHSFTLIRDRVMRWNGVGSSSPLVRIETEWFYNPVIHNVEEGVTEIG